MKSSSLKSRLSMFCDALCASLALISLSPIARADNVATHTVQGTVRAAMLSDKQNSKIIAQSQGIDWCQTQLRWVAKQSPTSGLLACPQEGTCDIPTVRNGAIPSPTDPTLTIRLRFHVFAEDNGSALAATQAQIDAQVTSLNSHFAPSRVDFEHTTEFINSTQYRYFSDPEEGGMKSTYADSPDSQLNIYVVAIQESYIGVGTFPWDNGALGVFGGIILDDNYVGLNEGTLTHEIGHCLGLWHTHHGVSEVGGCAGCRELVGASDHDFTGDFCSDTDPTPTNFSCGPPGGVDACNNLSWGPTDPQNYMGYAPDNCYTEFSSQQWGRMHCWVQSSLATWVTGVRLEVDSILGAAPLTTQFTGISNKVVTDWDWDFGDNGSASVQSPSHIYTLPGIRTVGVDIQTTSGPYSSLRKNLIAVYADTLKADSPTTSPGQSVRIDISLTNYIPLRQIQIPFEWSGALGLLFDSVSTVGMRTEFLTIQGLIAYDDFLSRATFSATAVGANPYLVPGTGPVVSVYFSTPANAPNANNPFVIAPYDSYQPRCVCDNGIYSPALTSGLVLSNPCVAPGDADGNNDVNISDAVALIAYIFQGGPAPAPVSKGDADCDAAVDIGDAIYLISYIFLAGPPPCLCAP